MCHHFDANDVAQQQKILHTRRNVREYEDEAEGDIERHTDYCHLRLPQYEQ